MQGALGQVGLSRPHAPRFLTVAAVLALAGLTTACGSAASPSGVGTFTPGATASTAAPASSGGTGTDDFVMPPFGSNLHVMMSAFLPPVATLIPAVVAAKDYYLALYYSEYTGGSDTRWMTYTAGTQQTTVGAFLKGPVVAGQSFTGTLTFTDMSAAPDKIITGDIDVFMCVDSSHTTEVTYPGGRPLAKQPPLSQDDFRQMLYMAEGSNGQWYMDGATNPHYLPAAQGCSS
jgi:hypothetical protein